MLLAPVGALWGGEPLVGTPARHRGLIVSSATVGEELSRVLDERYGYLFAAELYGPGATGAGILRSLAELRRHVDEETALLAYLSLPLVRTSGRLFFVPDDGSAQDGRSLLLVEDVLAQLADAGAGWVFLVLDGCVIQQDGDLQRQLQDRPYLGSQVERWSKHDLNGIFVTHCSASAVSAPASDWLVKKLVTGLEGEAAGPDGSVSSLGLADYLSSGSYTRAGPRVEVATVGWRPDFVLTPVTDRLDADMVAAVGRGNSEGERGKGLARLSAYVAALPLHSREVLAPQAAELLTAIALGSDEPQRLRRSATFYLPRLGDPAAEEYLLRIYRDSEDPNVQLEAVTGLATMGGPEAIGALEDALRSGHASVRAAAVRGLMALESHDSAPAVLKLLQRETELEPVLAALTAVQVLQGDRDEVFAVVARVLRPGRPLEPEVQAAALQALGELADPRALFTLLTHLEAPDRSVRRAAAYALGSLPRETIGRALDPLQGALRDEDPSVREAAAVALGRSGSPAAVPSLRAALRDRDGAVRAAAADALGETKDPSAVGALIQALSDERAAVRRSAALAVGHLAEELPDAERALAAVLALQDDPKEDPYVREAARQAAERIGTRATGLQGAWQAALESDLPDARAAALRRLSASGAPDTASILLDYLDDPAPDVRVAAVESLASLEDPTLPGLLGAKARDGSAAERAGAVAVLGRRQGPDSLEELLGLWWQSPPPPLALLRDVVTALGNFVDPRALAAVTKAADHENELIRAAALRALNQQGTALYNAGDFDAGYEQLQAALRVSRSQAGSTDPTMVTTLNNLGAVMLARDEYGEAEGLLTDSLRYCEHSPRCDPLNSAAALNNLGQLYRKQGLYDMAERYLLEALGVQRRALGADPSAIVESLQNLADFYREKGDADRAESYAEQARETASESQTRKR